jgi:hypothetical protein
VKVCKYPGHLWINLSKKTIPIHFKLYIKEMDALKNLTPVVKVKATAKKKKTPVPPCQEDSERKNYFNTAVTSQAFFYL